MKKTLAIVLALVMVLCMVPAMSAETTTTMDITNKNYSITVESAKVVSGHTAEKNTAEKANSITFEYNYEKQDAFNVDKWADNAKMAIVTVQGFNGNLPSDSVVTIDGQKLVENKTMGTGFVASADYARVIFPVELTKAGYSDTYLIQVTGTKDGVTYTETAKVTVKLVNTAAYKDAKTATITNIESQDSTVSAYIVGSKIYLDNYTNTYKDVMVDITFADENGAKFSAITYTNGITSTNSAVKVVTDKTYVTTITNDDGSKDQKLDNSVATYKFNGTDDSKVIFKLETKGTLYETKKYDVVNRKDIKEEDPKGIYFAETTKTIAMGEKYAPVVMGVATGKKVAAKIDVSKAVDGQVLDLVDDYTIIGTREGVAYITASYTLKGETRAKYTASSMKITVTLPGESIPALDPATTTYYVTCRTLNVRAGAGTSYKKVSKLSRNTAVKVVEIKNGWAKLADNTYVCAKYIAK